MNLPKQHIRTTQLMFIAFSLFALIMFLWSILFEIDIISNADGQIIPAGEIKTIQHLEGGIIDQILVKESEKVTKDQPSKKQQQLNVKI